MAHSYLSVKKTEQVKRLFAAPDALLHLFMYFFNEVAKPTVTPFSKENEICEHYLMELLEVHTSWIDAQEELIAQNPQLKSWYLSMLLLLDSRFDNFGENIDNDYLNRIPELIVGYPRGSKPWHTPVKVSTMKNFINDVRWVFNKKGIEPSGQFKCFEVNDEQST